MVNNHYDLYDKSKRYTKVLAAPGRVLQSREFNEVQSTMKDHLGRVGNALLNDGVIQGCAVIIHGNELRITPGQIFLNGLVHDTSETILTISRVGTEILGVKLQESVITAEDDPTLKDPAQGYDNYQQDGADRLKEELIFTINDVEALAISVVVDGNLQTNESVVINDKFTETLARRTFDESGNYKTEGLEIVPKGLGDATHVFMTLERGKAYIKGYEVVKNSSVTFQIPKSMDTKEVQSEPKKFKTGVMRYSLNNPGVKSITKIVSEVEVTGSVTRGNVSGGIDFLSKKPVVSVVSVIQNGTTYVEGVDFNLLNDGIDWSPAGSEPELGSTYQVVWTYNKVLDSQLDYGLVQINGNSYLQFVVSGDHPVPDSTFHVDYEFFLARKDLICLDYKGQIQIIPGQPDLLRLVETPTASNYDYLRLATVTMAPNSLDVKVIDVSVTNTSMEHLAKIIKRVEQLEYNDAITDLDKEAIEGEGATQLKGVLTDSFIGFTKSDTGREDFTAAMDIDKEELTLSAPHEFQEVVLGGLNTSARFNNLSTAKYKEVVGIEQPMATGVMKINPYLVFPQVPSLKLSPEMDSWVEESKIVIDGGTQIHSIRLRRWWGHQGESWAAAEKKIWEDLGLGDYNEWDAPGDIKYTTVTEKVLEETLMYMRQRSVSFTAESFEPFADNIDGRFDGVIVPLSPKSAEYAGATAGTLKADSKGVVSGSFIIPANIRTGTRELALTPRANLSHQAKANYTANGRKRVVRQTVFNHVVKIEPYDPLAQTFEFEQDRMITSIDLFFAEKDSTNNITVQIRGTDNGYPNTTVYSEVVLKPTDILTSSNSSLATKVRFPDPVYCEAYNPYCVVVLTESDVDSMFIATMGEKDVLSNMQVVKQPYIAGTLFSSSNAKTWTAHQTQDMKFRLYCAEFDETSEMYFNTLEGLSADRFLITADLVVPKGCDFRWEYRLDGGSWSPTAEYVDREFSSIVNKIDVRALITTNKTTSPAIAMDSIQFISFRNNTESVYVSRNVYHSEGFEEVKQVVEMYKPIGSNIVVKFATDGAGEVWETAPMISEEQVSDTYSRFTFKKTLGATKNNFRARVELSTNDRCSRPRVRKLMNIFK